MKLKVNEDAALFAKAGRALGWSFASSIIGRLSTFVIAIALARILGPAAFGTYAVAMVALLAVLSFNELGVSLAIVRWPGDPYEIAPTVASISLLSSVLIYVGCFFGAPAFADAMGDPNAVGVLRVIALSVIVSGLVATPVALLQREFRQDRKMMADLVGSWLSALTSIGCALSGLGAMSLAIGHLTGVVAGAVLFGSFAPRGLRFGFRRDKAVALLRFGLPLAGSSIVVFAVTNVDKFIIGAIFGPVPLGFYVLASNLSNWPIGIFSQPVRSVAPAALARLQHDPPAMRATFLSAAGLLVSITLPVCVLMASGAGPLVRFLYGIEWEPAAKVLIWLALLGALRIFFELVYDYFVVLASSRVVFTVQVIWLVALVGALYLGAQLADLSGAAAAQLAVGLLVVLPIYLYELRRTGVGAGALAARVALPVLGAAAVAAATILITDLVSNDLLALALAGVVGVIVMGLLVLRLRSALNSLRTLAASPEPASGSGLGSGLGPVTPEPGSGSGSAVGSASASADSALVSPATP